MSFSLSPWMMIFFFSLYRNKLKKYVVTLFCHNGNYNSFLLISSFFSLSPSSFATLRVWHVIFIIISCEIGRKSYGCMRWSSKRPWIARLRLLIRRRKLFIKTCRHFSSLNFLRSLSLSSFFALTIQTRTNVYQWWERTRQTILSQCRILFLSGEGNTHLVLGL